MPEVPPSIRWIRDLLVEAGFDTWRIARIEEGSGSLASYDVDDRFILRVALSDEGRDGLSREIAVLGLLLGSRAPVPVPTYVSVGERDGSAWGIYPKLRGTSGRERQLEPGDHPRLAAQLGGLLRHVHGLPPPDEIPVAETDVPWRGRLEELPRLVGVLESSPLVDLNAEMRRYLHADVETPPAPHRLVLCHGDIKSEHILLSTDGSTIVGVIDWNDAMVADPAIDVAGAISWLGPRFGRSVAAVLDDVEDDAFPRALFLARVGMLWGLGRTLVGEDDWPLDLAARLVRTVFA
jgi:aminoglycoside phosphotransferase (APT) family kinase protein